tara:strand:+ start:744 stop:1328 length:585 start_codon:yes stop_codon:yes gene_type:complete
MKIVFCIPGMNFSNRFLESWTNLIQILPPDIEWYLNVGYTPNIFSNRQVLLDRAKTFDADYYMWIDSDQVFKPYHFFNLLKYNKNIVSGIYLRQLDYNSTLSKTYACTTLEGEHLNEEIRKNYKEKLIEVTGNGMGFMLTKSYIFNDIVNPFSSPDPVYGTSEDICFQVKAKEKGFKSYIDKDMIIGHEKTFIL